MFNISIWLPIWLPSPYTTGCSQDNHDISWLFASWLPCWGLNLIIQPYQIQLIIQLYQLVIKMFDCSYSYFYQLNQSIISPFKQTLFHLEKFQLLLQVSIHFVYSYHPSKWQCLLAGKSSLWMTIFAFLAMITGILYTTDSKIHCLNAALFSIAFCSRYHVD